MGTPICVDRVYVMWILLQAIPVLRACTNCTLLPPPGFPARGPVFCVQGSCTVRYCLFSLPHKSRAFATPATAVSALEPCAHALPAVLRRACRHVPMSTELLSLSRSVAFCGRRQGCTTCELAVDHVGRAHASWVVVAPPLPLQGGALLGLQTLDGWSCSLQGQARRIPSLPVRVVPCQFC